MGPTIHDALSTGLIKQVVFGTYEAGYDRNRILAKGLREAGAEVIECHVPVWEKMRHKTIDLKSPAQVLRLVTALTAGYSKLAWRYALMPEHDVVLVAYLGHFDVFPARVLSWLRNKPLVFDAFISLYDTSVEDRAVVQKGSLAGHGLRIVDRWACRLAELVLLDTREHINYFCREFALSPHRFERVLVGADPDVYLQQPAAESGDEKSSDDKSPFVVLHYSKFAPLHGIPYILDAASLLREHDDIVFKIVGGGQLYDECRAYADRLGLTNIELVPWLTPQELNEAIRSADVCLGIFGDTQKAKRVISF